MRRGVAAVQLAGGPAGQQGAGGLARSLSGQSGLEKGGREGGSEQERCGEGQAAGRRRGFGGACGGNGAVGFSGSGHRAKDCLRCQLNMAANESNQHVPRRQAL